MGYQSAEDRQIAELRERLRIASDEVHALRREVANYAADLSTERGRADAAEIAHARTLGTLDAMRSYLRGLFTDLSEHVTEMKSSLAEATTESDAELDPHIRSAVTAGEDIVLRSFARLFARMQETVDRVGR